MLIVNPSVELLSKGDNSVSFVAKCARVCYDRESGNDERTYNNLIKSEHFSVFRHASYYAIVPVDDIGYGLNDILQQMCDIRHIGIDAERGDACICVAYNGNFALDYPEFHQEMQPYLVSPEEFAKHAPELMRYTFRCITQDSIAKELNRVSPNNITEMSTRYVDLENGAICKPHWMSEEDADKWNNGDGCYLPIGMFNYLISCESSFTTYRDLIKNYRFKREDARGALPKDTATKVFYTYNLREWRHIIDLRTSERAHPNARIIANMIKDELVKLGYEF